MANRRPNQNNGGGRRMDYGRNARPKNFNRPSLSPWQGGGPSVGVPNLLPLGGSSDALAIANNLISNLLQSRSNPVPSLLDMPMRRDFGPDLGRFDRGYVPNRMGNQGNFRRTGTYNRAGERINTYRKPFRPNDGPRNKQSSPKKDADKAKPVVKTESNEEKNEAETTTTSETSKQEDKKEALRTRYDDLSSQLLKCHICNKSMWDGRSFENHLSGRAHAIMMQKTAESYALTADTMRQEFKIREMKRTRKTGQMLPRDFYCAMCDMYASDGAIHRTTVGHRKLKKYLHPNCTSCHKEMPTRIELDEHRLTPEHLRNVQDKQEVIIKPKPEVMVISTLRMERSYIRDDRLRKRLHSIAVKEEDETNDNADDENMEMKKDIKVESVDGENTVLDYQDGDDLANFTVDMLPVYSTERGVGRSFLGQFSCVQCLLCRKLLDSQETAEVHLKTWRHHQLFLKMLREKSGIDSVEGGKRGAGGEGRDGGGDNKRRKVAVGDEEDANGDQQHTEDMNSDVDMEAEMGLEDTGADEDWEQTVDDILQDEKDNSNEDVDLQLEEEMEKEEVVEPEPEPEPVPEPKTPSRRGRGRGRGRK